MAMIPTAENFRVLPQGLDSKFTAGPHPVDVMSAGTKELQRGLGIWAQRREDEAADDAANKYMTYCAENQQKYGQLSNEAAIRDENGHDVLETYNRERRNFRSNLMRGMTGTARQRFEHMVASTDRHWILATQDHRYKQEKSVDETRTNLLVDNFCRNGLDALAVADTDPEALGRFNKSLSDSAGVFREHIQKHYGWYDEQTVNRLVGMHMANQLIYSIQVLNERDSAKALEIFKTYGQMLPANAYANLMKDVLRADEQAKAADIWEQIQKTGSVVSGATGVGMDKLSKSAFEMVRNDRRPYSQGANRSDCSSFLGEMVAYTGVDNATRKLFQGTSDSIIRNLGKKYGFGVQGGKLPDKIGAGVVISLDTGNYDYDSNHWNGIDHIAVTVQGKDGKIYVAEKTKSGAKTTEYSRWKNFGTYRKAKVWTVDASPAFGISASQSGGKRIPVNVSDMNMSYAQIMKVIKANFPGRSDTFYRTLAELAKDQAEDNRERKHLHDEAIHNTLSRKRLAVDAYNTETAVKAAQLREVKARANAYEAMTPEQQKNYSTSQAFQGEENWVWSGWKLADPKEFGSMSLVDVASLTAGDGVLNSVMTNTWNWYNNRKKYNPNTPVLSPADINYTYQVLGLKPGNLSIEDKNKIGRTLHYAYTHRNEKSNGRLKYPTLQDAIARGAEEQMGFFERMGLSF